MDETERVHAGQRPQELLDVVPRAAKRQPRERAPRPGEPRARDGAGDDVLQGVAVDVLHDDRELLAPIDERVKADHVGVRERPERLGLVREERADLGPPAHAGGEHFDGDRERRVRAARGTWGVEEPPSPDDPHSTFAETCVDDDPHPPEINRGACSDRHVRPLRLQRAAMRANACAGGDSGVALRAVGRHGHSG